MIHDTDRLSDLNGRVAALSVVESRIQHLAARVSVPAGTAMYQVLSEVIYPERTKYQGFADEERAKREAKAALPQPVPAEEILEDLRGRGLSIFLEEIHASRQDGPVREKIALLLAKLKAAGL